MISPNRLLVALLALTIALPLAAAPAAAADPTGAPLPAELSHPSAQAEMLAQHANDRVGAAPSASGSVASLAADTVPLATVASAYSGPAGALPNGLRREVLGFLPYWYLTSSKLAALRYDLVSTIAYFSVGAQSNGYLLRGTSTNPAIGWTSWNSSAMTDVINAAHARGVRVVPTITMMAWDYNFAGMTQLLTGSTYRTRLVGEIVKMVADRRADGVNIDFEPVPSSLRAAFTAFVRQVKAGLVNAHLPSYVTVDTSAGAAAWSTGYDVVGLTAPGAANALMVMAYDLNWSGSSRAGGVAPIDSPYAYDVRQAMTDYLALGAPPGKLIWGVPYYGRAWNTADGSLNAVVRSPASSTAFIYYGTDADGPFGGKVLGQTYGRKWDATGQGAWVAWQASDGWREAYYDDPASLGVKYRMVSGREMAGIGIWSLGMDAGTNDLSNMIYDRFVKLDVRLAGSNRYATAAAVSRSAFRAGAAVAYVASGEGFADALAGGPAAALGKGPVLLTARDGLPTATAIELGRLAPQRIVVLGGTAVVSDVVLRALRGYTTGSVTRVAGTNRYATAAGISAVFPAGVKTAYVSSGLAFADALSGGASAARQSAPMLLTTNRSVVPQVTLDALARLKPGRIVVLGGSGMVPDAQLATLARYTSGTVTRVAGVDRYGTSVAVSRASFGADGPGTVYLATGANFPDGLAGASPAGLGASPLLLTGPTSLPSVVADELRRLNPSRVVILGGTASVGSGVVTQIRALWD